MKITQFHGGGGGYHPCKGRSNPKNVPGQMRVSWDESGDGRGRSRAKKETNKEGKSCAAPRRCCPRSQISLRTYYGYFSCGPLLQSLPRNRNRARLFGIMFRWRQEFQEVLIPDIRGCRASSSFHIILVMVGELTLTAQTFAGKKFPKFRYSLSRRSLVFPFYSPTPYLCAFFGLLSALLLCSRNKASAKYKLGV